MLINAEGDQGQAVRSDARGNGYSGFNGHPGKRKILKPKCLTDDFGPVVGRGFLLSASRCS